MSMTEWAKREVEIASEKARKDDDEGCYADYACGCYDSALKAYNGLMEDGHSGMSFNITRSVLNRLLAGKPLSPIYDTEDVWNDVTLKGETVKRYQCKRMSSLFKDVDADGTVKYTDVGMYQCIDINNPTNSYTCGLVANIIDKLFPISMPYNPKTENIKVFCEDFLTDRKNGDFDTMGIFYALTPDTQMVKINLFFKTKGSGWEQITEEEYKERKNRRIK